MMIYQPNQFRTNGNARPRRGASYIQKAEALDSMTQAFCRRFVRPGSADAATRMEQDALAGRQSIEEGSAAVQADTEAHLRMLGEARGSYQSLCQSYQDYLQSRHFVVWTSFHPRFAAMQAFCKSHNRAEDYAPYFEQWNDEEMANTAITLCHQVDTMLNKYLRTQERMMAMPQGAVPEPAAGVAALGAQQEAEVQRLRQEVERLQALLRANGIEY